MRIKQGKPLKEYVLDLLIIVVGISISLYAGSLLENRNERKEQVRILENLKQNLMNDTTSIQEELTFLHHCQRRYQYILSDSFHVDTDSLGFQFLSMLVYTTNEIQETAYEEMKSSGKMHIIDNKDLLNQTIHHYESAKLQVDEYNSIDKHFILNRMIPYMETNFKWYSSAEMYNPQQAPAIQAFLQETNVRNLLQTNLIFKVNTIQSYQAYLTSANALIGQINQELED